MPDAFAALGVQADEARGEQIVAGAVAAVEIVRRRAEGDVHIAQLLVAANNRPRVGAAGVLPRTVFPGLVAEFALLRDGMEGPQLLARAHIESANVATHIFFG